MKLLTIWNSVDAWKSLQVLKKNPALAHKLLNYAKLISNELDTINKQKDQLVYEAAGVEPPTPPEVLIITIEKDTPQHDKFVILFNGYLQEESTLPVFDMAMTDLIAALSAKEGNTISENEIALLEPFFK